VPGTAPVRRRGLSRSYVAAEASRADAEAGWPDAEAGWPDAETGGAAAGDVSDLHHSLPGTLEYWADPDRSAPSPFRYLTALRQNPPGIKSFG
jgi:hypothetical protein